MNSDINHGEYAGIKKRPGYSREIHLRLLCNLKNNYSSKVPDEMVSGDTPYFKVRKNWFHKLVGRFEFGEKEGYIESDKLKEAISLFIDDYTSETYHTRITTKADIERADTLLKEVINEIKKELTKGLS